MLSAILVTGSNFDNRQKEVEKLTRRIFAPSNIELADVVRWSVKEIKETRKKESVVSMIKKQIQWLSLSAHNQAGIKVWLIYQAQLLSIPAQNTLLKTLEEPLPQRYIILEAKNPDQLLPTIISRVEIISLSSDVSQQTKGWSWLAKNLSLPYPKLRLVAERLALQDREKIKLFLQECQREILDERDLPGQGELFKLFSFTLKGLNHNLNLKHLLIHLFWQAKAIKGMEH